MRWPAVDLLPLNCGGKYRGNSPVKMGYGTRSNEGVALIILTGFLPVGMPLFAQILMCAITVLQPLGGAGNELFGSVGINAVGPPQAFHHRIAQQGLEIGLAVQGVARETSCVLSHRDLLCNSPLATRSDGDCRTNSSLPDGDMAAVEEAAK
jgi:hypothetical protein